MEILGKAYQIFIVIIQLKPYRISAAWRNITCPKRCRNNGGKITPFTITDRTIVGLKGSSIRWKAFKSMILISLCTILKEM